MADDTAVTRYQFGARARAGEENVSVALQQAIRAGLSRGLPVDLCGGTWRSDAQLDAVGDLHLRNGTVLSRASSVALSITHPETYTRPRICNVTLRAHGGGERTALRVERGLGVRLENFGIEGFGGGACRGLHLLGCQVITWLGGLCAGNDQHILLEDLGELRSTDLRVVGVSFSGGHGAGIYCYNARGIAFRACTFSDTDAGPLMDLHACANSTLVDCRMVQSRPAAGRTGLRLGGLCQNIRLLGCSFTGMSPAIIAADSEMTAGLGCDFGGAPPVEPAAVWVNLQNPAE